MSKYIILFLLSKMSALVSKAFQKIVFNLIKLCPLEKYENVEHKII